MKTPNLATNTWHAIDLFGFLPDGKTVLFGRLDKSGDFWYDYAPANFHYHNAPAGWYDEFGTPVNEDFDATHFMILERPV
jgi:hypothetical protein